MAEKVPLVI